jgi:hypothetical protein
MMFIRYLFLFSLAIFFFSGCGRQPYLHQESAFIVLKTPVLRYADQGFVYENEEEVKVEIYGSGQALFSMTITPSSVCTGTFSCMEKKRFNAKVLSSAYPDDILASIFRGEPIFDGENLSRKRNGFTQELINGNKYHIMYSVLNNETVFRDTINHILIKIKRL